MGRDKAKLAFVCDFVLLLRGTLYGLAFFCLLSLDLYRTLARIPSLNISAGRREG